MNMEQSFDVEKIVAKRTKKNGTVSGSTRIHLISNFVDVVVKKHAIFFLDRIQDQMDWIHVQRKLLGTNRQDELRREDKRV